MSNLLTFKTLARAEEMAAHYMANNAGATFTITRLPDGRFRLDLQDPPRRQPVA